MSKIQPIQDCLLVRPDADRHELFILISDKKTGTGVVLAVGPDVVDIKEGDRIAFGEFVGQDFKWEGEVLLGMREKHVMGVYQDA